MPPRACNNSDEQALPQRTLRGESSFAVHTQLRLRIDPRLSFRHRYELPATSFLVELDHATQVLHDLLRAVAVLHARFNQRQDSSALTLHRHEKSSVRGSRGAALMAGLARSFRGEHFDAYGRDFCERHNGL